jgi:cytochrome P450
MIYIVAVAIVLVFLSISLFFKKKRSTKNPSFVKRLPGGLPFIGNVFDFVPEKMIETFQNVPAKYGPFVEFNLLGTPGLTVCDPVIGKEILMKRPKSFRRTSLMDHFIDTMNLRTGLFLAEGHTWSRIRKSTLSSFSNLSLSRKYAALTGEIFEWMKRIHETSTQHVNQAIDMRKDSFSLTIRAITLVAFGLEKDDPLCVYFYNEFREDMNLIFDFLGESTMYPLPKWTWKFSPKYKTEVEALKADARFTVSCAKIIQQKRQLFKDGKLAMNCMIDSLIAYSDDASGEKAMTDEEIIANVKVFYLAGADSTAISLSWLCYYFAVQPEVLAEVEKEAKNVLLKDFPWNSLAGASSPSFEKKFEALRAYLTSNIDMNVVMKQLPYMNAVIKEVLRLGSPSTFVGLESISEEPIVLSNGITIENKDIVFVNIEGGHASAEVFPNPKEFNPNRWFISDAKKLQSMEAHCLSFGGGSRVCPAMTLAMHELYLSVSIMSLFFKLELDCPKEEVVRTACFVAVPNKVPVIFTTKIEA